MEVSYLHNSPRLSIYREKCRTEPRVLRLCRRPSSGGASSSHPAGHYFTLACMSVFLCRPSAALSVSPLHLVLVSQVPASLSFPSPVLPKEGAASFRRLVSKHAALIFHGCAFFLLLPLLFSLGCAPNPPPPPFV